MRPCIPYDRLLLFREGLLPVRERSTVQAHIDGCVRCRRELGRIEKMIEWIEEHPGEEFVRTPKRLLKSALTMIPVPEQRESPAPKPFGAMEGLRKIVARWITPSISQSALARNLSLADRTGRDPKRRFGLYKAEGLEIALSIKRQKNGRWVLLGELFPETPSGDAMLSLRGGIGSSRACLEHVLSLPLSEAKGEAEGRSRKVPLEASRFGFYDVEEGEYLVHILCGDQVIEIPDVVVT